MGAGARARTLPAVRRDLLLRGAPAARARTAADSLGPPLAQFTHSPSVELALELDGTTLGNRQVQIKRKKEASVLVRETETQAAAMGLAGSASFYPATRGGGAWGGGGGGRGRGRGRASSYAFTHGGRGRGRGRAFTPGRGRGRGRGAANGGVVARRVWRRDAGEAAGDSTALAT